MADDDNETPTPSSAVLEPILKGMRKGQTLEQFLAESPPLESGFNRRRDEMIERVVRFLKENITSISIAKIVKGGSIGKNTMVHSSSDVDLFIFINELKSIEDMKKMTRGILDIIRVKLDSMAWHSSAGIIEFQSYTDHSIKFLLTCPDLGQQHTIDILPAYDILHDQTLRDVYKDMKNVSDKEREYYSVCLGPVQIGFIKEAPSKLQDLMKIIKYWTKIEVNAEVKSTTSYFMEVLVMSRWHESKQPYDFSLSDWFEDIVAQLADFTSLSIFWENRYTVSDYWSPPSGPMVLDPANPYKNVVPPRKYQKMIMKLALGLLDRFRKLREYLKSGPPPVMKHMRRGQTLQQFIVEKILPDLDFRQNCDELVERVTYFLQHHTNFSVSMVVKGGSLGKSTNILGKSDVDLVVFINTMRSVKDLETNMDCLLTKLKNDLASKWSGFAGSLHPGRQTPHGLQYSLSCSDGGHLHDMDILPACHVLKDKTVQDVHNEMAKKTASEREYYSVCFAQKQVEFVKQVPIKVKNLIRLVKYWAKTELNTERKKVVTSYFLECLVMYHWIEKERPEDFNTNNWFKTIMIQLANLTSMRILWLKHFPDTSHFNVNVMYPTNPVFLDPGNPFRNLVPRDKYYDLVIIRARIVVQKIQDLNSYRSGQFLDS